MKCIKSHIFYNERFYNFMLIEKQKIIYIGNEKPKKKIDYDFSNKYIYAGFIDSHTHVLWHGLNLLRCDLNGTKNAKEIYSRVKAYYKTNSHIEYIIAEGFDETFFNDKSFPEKNVLDEIFPHIPVILRRVDGHIAVLNESAYKLLKHGLEIYDKKTGIAKEGIILQLNSEFAPAKKEKEKAIFKAQSDFFSKGITSVGDMSTIDALDIYSDIKLDLDIFFYYPYKHKRNLKKWKNKRNIKLKGLKIFTDGSIGAYSAAIKNNYKYKKTNGVLLENKKTLINIQKFAEKNNYQLAVHAIGDKAIELCVNLLNSGHRIEHFELPEYKHIEIVKKKDIYLSMQPNFIGKWGMKNSMYEKRLTKKYFEFNNPINYISQKGINIGLGSDCMPVSAIYGLNSLKKALFDNQKMSVKEGYKLYTKGNMKIMNLKNRGELKKNYFADFIVLNNKIENIKNDRDILFTFKKGNLVYKRR